MDKVESKNERRTLKVIDNKVHFDPIRKSKSKSLKRTERSMSKEHKSDAKVPPKPKPSSMSYKIGCYSDRKASLRG
jgi:hypothetical protein